LQAIDLAVAAGTTTKEEANILKAKLTVDPSV
jgi:hypothetical protein